MPLRKKVNLLREIRTKHSLSGYDLQILSHISAQHIYLIERGLKKPQHYEKVLIAEALQIPISTIFPKHLEHTAEIEGETRKTTLETEFQIASKEIQTGGET